MSETSFPATRYAWRRFKLLLAELLIMGFTKGDHSIGYHDRLSDVIIALNEFRETYYPRSNAQPAKQDQ